MGAAGAHDRGTGRNGVLQGLAGMYGATQLGGHQVLGELTLQRQHILAPNLQAQLAAVVLDDGVQLLHDHQLVHLAGKVQNQLHRQGVDHAQLEHRHAVSKDLLHILIGGGRGEHAHGGAAHLHPVKVAGLGKLGELAGALLHHRVTADGVARHHHVLGDVLLIGLLHLGALPQLHQGLGVGHAGAHLQDDRGVKLLGDLIGPLGKGQGLGGVRGLQHRHLGCDGIVAGVLLVLR